jgi:hypothetical protein
LRRSGWSLLASLALPDIKFESLLASLALLNLVLEYSVVCRARRSTQAKTYTSRARVSSLFYSRPQLAINPSPLLSPLLRNSTKQPSTITMGTVSSVKRKKCTFEDNLNCSHGLLPLHSTCTSTCQWLRLGRDSACGGRCIWVHRRPWSKRGAAKEEARRFSQAPQSSTISPGTGSTSTTQNRTRSSGLRTNALGASLGARARLTTPFLTQKGYQGMSLAGTRLGKTRLSQRPSVFQRSLETTE